MPVYDEHAIPSSCHVSYHSIASDISDNDSNRAAFTREHTHTDSHWSPPHEMAALITPPYRYAL